MGIPYKVLIKIDNASNVIAITSDAFADESDGWIRVDEGYGDKYHHAQNYYLSKNLTDMRGVYRYKFVGGEIKEKTQEEMDADYNIPTNSKSLEQRVNDLEVAMGGFEEGIREIVA